MQKVLITGVTGFVGSHLADYLLSLGDVQIYGTIRHRSKLDNILHIQDKIKLFEGDLTDATSVDCILKEVMPDYIFHLAAQSFVPYSWVAPSETLKVNIFGAVNILEFVRRYLKDCIVLLAGTSEEYGLVYQNELPIKESNVFRPLSVYGISKVAQENLGYVYYRSYGVKTILTRSFNHFCGRRGFEFVESKITRQALEILLGKRDKFSLGNLDTVRDFTDARDIVRCYWLLSQEAANGNEHVLATPLNLCSGKGYVIKDLLNKISGIVGISPIIDQDSNSLRPKNADVPILIGDCLKVEQIIGKVSKIPIEDSLNHLIEYWRLKI